jgi:imidazole glycerol phosphate synthase subunit HisF
VLIDISSTRNETRPKFLESKEIVSKVFVPIDYGGGMISKLEHIEKLLNIRNQIIIISLNEKKAY